tara:strand:- start:13820 stop:14008 length:189 start_codon:yes stop_codon:yes gene_type:complete
MCILYLYLGLSVIAATVGVVAEIEKYKPCFPNLPELFFGVVIDLLFGPIIIVIALIQCVRGK